MEITITPEKLQELRKDPFMRFLCDMVNLDLDKLIDEKEKEFAKQAKLKEESKNIKDPNVRELFARLAKQIEEAEKVQNTMRQEIVSEEKNKKPYEAPKCKELSSFVMNKEQFRDFCINYAKLLNAIKKLEYVYGISFEASSTENNMSELIRTIIWDLIRIIFGDENADDIADFLYGNSNFDSPDKLYDELT